MEEYKMANKFQKSVQERLEAEEKRRKATASPEITPLEEKSSANSESEVSAPLQEESTVPAASPDIRVYLTHEPQRVAKNKTFYLDAAVIEAVKRISREQQVTESRLVNDILRRVLEL
jgi:hypothetical protein